VVELRDLLTGSGYSVAEAADARDGVAKTLSERPDFILLPGLDGYETTRQIRQIKSDSGDTTHNNTIIHRGDPSIGRGRLAYGVAPIGKTVTTGASQAMAPSCGTAGGEADGPGF
jgi:DNA-binding NarL/FixJ family response regulator